MQPIEPVNAPLGIRIRPCELPRDAVLIHRALHDSFQDHFNPIDFTLEQTTYWLSGPDSRPDLMLLAVALDASGSECDAAGICLNSIRTTYNQQFGKLEGEVGTLGVRREYRRRGVARAMLTQSLELLKSQGMTSVMLAVDSENPTGATHLYSSVGFTPRKTSVVMQLN
jgi:ribosomal protein S18 acetylase RimI-like enzyme